MITETIVLRTLQQTPRPYRFFVEAASQKYEQTIHFVHLGGVVNDIADIACEMERRIQLAWVCCRRLSRESLASKANSARTI